MPRAFYTGCYGTIMLDAVCERCELISWMFCRNCKGSPLKQYDGKVCVEA